MIVTKKCMMIMIFIESRKLVVSQIKESRNLGIKHCKLSKRKKGLLIPFFFIWSQVMNGMFN